MQWILQQTDSSEDTPHNSVQLLYLVTVFLRKAYVGLYNPYESHTPALILNAGIF